MDKNVDDTKLENNTTPETEDQENAQTNPEQQEEKKEDKRFQNTIKNLTILFLILVILILLLRSCACGPGAPVEPAPTEAPHTAILAKDPIPVDNTADTSGMVRIILNPYIHVQHQTIQDLEMENKNEDRLMMLTITNLEETETYYTSQNIKPGEEIIADVFDASKLSTGTHNVMGHVQFSTLDNTVTNVTNVEMTITIDEDQSTNVEQ